jgi:glutathionylspermidine synthase
VLTYDHIHHDSCHPVEEGAGVQHQQASCGQDRGLDLGGQQQDNAAQVIQQWYHCWCWARKCGDMQGTNAQALAVQIRPQEVTCGLAEPTYTHNTGSIAHQVFGI